MKRLVIVALALSAAAAVAWAQDKKAGQEAENGIRQAAFHYVYGGLLGDTDEYMKGVRLPVYIVRDGVGATYDEKRAKARVAAVAEKMAGAKLTDDDRKRIGSNLLVLVDQASLQFVGAHTASVAIAIRPAAKEGEGDSMMQLVLHRKDGRWQVVTEVTDSTAVPPEYLKE